MAEDQEQDAQQKTEEATPHRLQKALEKGQVPISKEAGHWMSLFAGALIIGVVSPFFMSEITFILKSFLAFHDLNVEDNQGLTEVISDLLIKLGTLMIIPIILIMGAGLFSGLAQTKFNVSFESIKPKLEKLSLLKGFTRIFSGKALFEFLKGLIKIVIVGAVVIIVLTPELTRLPLLAAYTPSQILAEIQKVLIELFVTVLAIMGVLAILDYFFERFQMSKQLRMSKQDIKDEHKETEGDPEIKQRLSQLRHSRYNQRTIAKVPEATVVITNPTHFAIALLYKAGEMEAPIVIAKGLDFLAQKMREVAEENDVPIIENPPLARALYATVEIDEEIPTKYYTAVANIIRYVMGIDKQLNNQLIVND